MCKNNQGLNMTLLFNISIDKDSDRQPKLTV